MHGKKSIVSPGTFNRRNTKTGMTLRQAAQILRKYNTWRREKHAPCDPPCTAKDIGIAIDMAADLIENSIARSNIESIIKAVTRETGVTDDEMCNRGRQREYSEARAIVSYLAYKFTPMTLTAIGNRLGRDHATAIYYNKTVSGWLNNKFLNERGRNIVVKLINEIKDERQS